MGAIHYAWITSILVIVSSFEISMLANEGLSFFDSIVLCLSLIAFISHTSYKQSHLVFCYLSSMAYASVRTFFHMPERVFLGNYCRFLVLFGISLAIFSFSARKSIQISRDKFIQMEQQAQTLKLFNNLIKLYHDGLIITNNEDILFYNEQVGSIFNVTSPAKDEHEIVMDQSQQGLCLKDNNNEGIQETNEITFFKKFLTFCRKAKALNR